MQLLTTGKKTLLALMEEGLSSQLTISNELSVSAIQSVNLVLDSMKKSGYQVAMDQFVGNIFVKEYLGQMLQYFKPRNLSLFQLAVIAQVVHTSYPNYAILNTQCYYYATLVYAVAKKIGGIKASEGMDKENIDLVSISGSYLSNHYG